jgi:hypothetical protein
MALTLNQIREQYPELTGTTDEVLVNFLHQNYYSDIPIDEFSKAVGFNSEGDAGALRSYALIPALKGTADIGGAVGYGLEASGIAPEYGRDLQYSAQDVNARLTARQSQEARDDAAKTLIDENGNYGGYNLGTLSQQLFQSAPGMLAMGAPGGLLARGATAGAKALGAGKAASTIGSGLGFGAAEGIYSGASNAAQIQEEIRNASFDQLVDHPAFIEAYHTETDPEASQEQRLEQARDILARKAGDDVFGKTAVTTGALSAVTGGGMFGMLRDGAKGGILSRVGQGFLKEGVLQEAPQSALEQRHSNVAKRDYLDPNQDVNQGVLSAGLEGGLVGGVMGAGGGVFSRDNSAAIAKIGESGSVDEAIAAAGNAVSQPIGLPAPNLGIEFDRTAAMPRDTITFSDGSTIDANQYFQQRKAEHGDETRARQETYQALNGKPEKAPFGLPELVFTADGTSLNKSDLIQNFVTNGATEQQAKDYVSRITELPAQDRTPDVLSDYRALQSKLSQQSGFVKNTQLQDQLKGILSRDRNTAANGSDAERIDAITGQSREPVPADSATQGAGSGIAEGIVRANTIPGIGTQQAIDRQFQDGGYNPLSGAWEMPNYAEQNIQPATQPERGNDRTPDAGNVGSISRNDNNLPEQQQGQVSSRYGSDDTGQGSLDPILTTKKQAWVKSWLNDHQIKPKSPGYGAKFKEAGEAYEQGLNKALAKAPFDVFANHPVNAGVPKGDMLKQAHDALRDEFGISDNISNSVNSNIGETNDLQTQGQKAAEAVSKKPPEPNKDNEITVDDIVNGNILNTTDEFRGVAKGLADFLEEEHNRQSDTIGENNPFSAHDDAAKEYGFQVRPDGIIRLKDGKESSLKVVIKKGRLRIENKNTSDLVYSGANKPENIGKFLEKFWYAEKIKPDQKEKANKEIDALADEMLGNIGTNDIFGMASPMDNQAKNTSPSWQKSGFNDIRIEFNIDDLIIEIEDTFPLKKIAASWDGISHSGSGHAKEERSDLIKTVKRLYDEAAELAETDKQKSALNNAIVKFKNDYIGQTLRLANARSGTYSSMIAGRSNFNSKQANRRGSAYDRANESFDAWYKKATSEIKQAVEDAKSPDQLAKEQQAKIDKKLAIQEKNDAFLRKFLNFKPGDDLKAGKYPIIRVSKDKDGLPNSLTISGEGILKGIDDKIKVVGVLYKSKSDLQAAIDRVNESSNQDQQAEPEADAEPVTTDAETQSESVDPASPIDAFKLIMQGLNEGAISIDEYKKGFEALVANKESVEAELSKQTKAKLLDSGYISYYHKNEKKDFLVHQAYKGMLADFFISDDLLSYGMGKDSYVNAIRNNVESLTQDDLDSYAAKRKKAIEDRKQEIAEKIEGVKDPKTLDDFQNYMRVKIQDEKLSFADARMTLTPDQRAKYDELVATKSRQDRSYRKERDTDYVATNRAETDAEIIKTVHTRDNYDLWVVKAADRVEREIYNDWNATAKKLGGWYSSFKGRGATPGFQFKTEESAQAFQQYISKGDKEAVQEQAKARRDAYQDDKTQGTVERLTEMADRLEESANDSLNQDRKVNTNRRAGMAARAEDAARKQIALASTMRNIADAISDGTANFLDRVRQKVQVEFLQGMVGSAHYRQLMDETKGSYGEYEKRKYEAPTQVTADYAEFPSYSAYRSDLANLARQLIETDGTKQLGKDLLKVADDVTDAYLKFAKENLIQVGGFRTKDGDIAAFSSMKQAELSIAASGYNGKAIPFKVSAREIIPILSPSEAQIRGIWKGDNDKRITLNRAFGDKLIAALGKANRKQQKISVPWQFERAHSDLSRLQKMGIESPAEFRAALREFIDLKEQPAQEDKIKKLERSMVGRANDGLDFFPTPQSVADEMIAAAEIQEGMKVLEPSAGMGHIADQIRDAGVDPDVIELSGNRRELLEAKGHNIVAHDFMDYSEGGYDRIIMNPPFSDRRDAAHVQHAYDLLKPGGRLVAIMGEGVFFGSDKKASSFMDWLDSVGGEHEKMPENTFMDKSLPVTTGVNTRMVVIDKPLLGETPNNDDLKYSRPTSEPTANKHTKASLTQSMQKVMDSKFGNGWFNRLLSTGKFEIISKEEAMIKHNTSAYRALGFYRASNGTTYFIADNISKTTDLYGLALHEISVHALHMGKNDAEFQSILKQLDKLKDRNPKIKAAYARIPDNTKAEHRLEELAAYLVQYSPSLPISKRIVAWFKNALRNIAKYLKGADRLKMMQWANRIDDADVVLMATKALKTAPDTLVLSNADLMNNGILRSNDTPDTIEVDGVQRPIVNSNGQQIHPTEEGIRNFWKWFGDSKVVDRQGRPLVVYHGTPFDFDDFDTERVARHYGKGAFFASDALDASLFSGGTSNMDEYGANPRIIPAYIKLDKPMRVKKESDFSEAKYIGGWLDRIRKMPPKHDGIITTATWKPDGIQWVIARSPSQIKSAIGNSGLFNGNDNDIRYSIESPQDLFDDLAEIPNPTYKDLLDKFLYSLSKGKSKSVELGLSALTQSQLTQIGAEILPNLKQFGIERNHYDVEESTWHNRADKIAEKWEKLIPGGKKFLNSKAWKHRNKLEQMRLSEVMHEMTVSEIDPRTPEPVPNDKNAAAIKAHKDLKAKYDKLLPDTKKLLDRVDRFHQAVLDKLVDSLTDKITASEMPEENKDRLVNDIKAKFKTQKGPYFPLMRFGNYWVDYDGGVQMFDSKKEQSDFIKKANDEGKIINGYGKSLKNFNKVEGVDAGFVDEVSGLIDDLDIEQAETLKDGIFQLYLSALPETSMRKRFIHRKKTPGWEQDALRSFSKKAFHDGKQLAKLQYAPAMRKVLADAEEIVKIGNSTRQKGNLERRIRVATEILDALDNGIEYDDLKDQYTQDDDLKLIRRFSRFTDEMDREKAIGDYLNGQRELLKAVEDYMKQDDPQELAADVIKALHKSYANMMESNTSPLTNLINQTVFTYFLGFNPASALINYFQTPGVALPVVAGRHGFAKASKELARAAKIFFTNTHSDDNSFSIQGGLTDAGEIMMYDALTSNGTFDRTRSHDLAGLSEEGIARGTLHRDLMQMSTFMFHKAEVANREITALMAYRLEYAKSGNRMQAIEYAADVVREAHLDYSSANRPDLFQGNATRIFLQFKMYSQGMTYLWGKTAWDSFKSKDPEKKRQARNTILSLIGVQTSMAGIMGLPIGGILLAAQALVSLMDDDDEPVDIEVEIRKALNSVLGDDLGRIAAKGALSETGADFSDRLSMSDLWIREPDKELEGKDASYYLLKTIAGPVAGIVEDIAVGMKLIGEGNTQRGMEKMLPHSVSGLAKAYRMIDEEGATSLTGNVIYETSAWEQAIQAMGMRPSGLAERQMQNSAIKNREMAITDTKSRLIAKAAQSRMKGDSEGYREAMQDIKRFNAKYPHLRITPASIVRSIKTRRANQRNAKDGLVVRKKLGFVREEESFI